MGTKTTLSQHFLFSHRGKYKTHGEWVEPVFPSNHSLQGSPQTPYIFDDRASYEDAGEALLSWYQRGPEERERCGEKGIEFVKDKNIGMDSKEMGDRFIKHMSTAMEIGNQEKNIHWRLFNEKNNVNMCTSNI